MKWVLIKVLSQESGYTENAIRSKIKKGIWRDSVHYLKAPDGRIMFNMEAIEKWVESKLV
jgi:putative excisionase DUF1233